MGWEGFNTFKQILLFSVEKGFKEIILSKGHLPILISDSQKSYLNGVLPVSPDSLDDITKRYLSERDNIIININGCDFLLTKIADDILIRHLPLVSVENLDDDPVTEKMAFAATGIIAVSSANIEKRFYQAYRIVSYIVNTRNIHAHIIEQNKFFSINDDYLNITNFFRPGTGIEQMLELSSQINYGLLVVPSCTLPATLELLIDISREKLVIAGTNSNCIEKLGVDKFLHISENESVFNTRPERSRTNIKVGTLINSLRSGEHA
ncbi:MAG: hypothetical protein JXA66_06835 [Oligoflexia bacterium]|nr:hypothetical protein [Oligoflexia bacterium]